MPRVLITGGNGFIGTNFALCSRYHETERISVRNIKPGDIDYSAFDIVLHLAAIVHHVRRIPESEYFLVNRDLTLEIARKAKAAGVSQFIFLSTIKVYGRINTQSHVTDENSDCNPDDPYGRSKYEAELALRKLEDDHFTISIIRTPIVYGLSVKANMLKLIRLIEKLPVLPFKNVNNSRRYSYVENLIGFIDRIIELRASGVFIAMDDSAVSTTQLVSFLAEFLKRKIVLFSVPRKLLTFLISKNLTTLDRLYGSFLLDNSKTKEILDFTPPYTIEEGLRKMITAYLENKESGK